DRNIAIIAEIKTRLRDADVQQLLDTLAAFPVFFPEHSQKRCYGLLVGGNTPESVRNLALSQGLYVGRMTDDTFELMVPAGFEGKNFQAGV
ncbi:MAG: DUF3782 domain-containing protein, partial [Bacteroidia bacterium]|nr:DUF3782 domain-containing protein [Bacteroidia bacterium]